MRDRYDPEVPGGGRAGGSGGSFHISFRSGSRGSGASAGSSFDYVTRNDEYDDPDRDPAIYTESEHMPSWAQEDAGEYWDAADLYERANGRLFVSADFALPRELSVEDQIELARDFAHELTDDEQLPYTLAIHDGRDADGQVHNPHAHLMFSERQNDGIERSRDEWFRRANHENPERGGAPKSRTFHGSRWVEQARERWAALTNKALERAGSASRVDHRSYARQGIQREPGRHFGPSAPHVASRGGGHERLEGALEVGDHEKAIRNIDNEIGQLEAMRESIMRDGLPEDRGDDRRDYSSSSGPAAVMTTGGGGDHGGRDGRIPCATRGGGGRASAIDGGRRIASLAQARDGGVRARRDPPQAAQ